MTGRDTILLDDLAKPVVSIHTDQLSKNLTHISILLTYTHKTGLIHCSSSADHTWLINAHDNNNLYR